MYLIDIVWSVLGLISFLLFVVFYKRLKTSLFWGKLHPAETWAMWQIIWASPRTGTLIYELSRGNDVNIFSILISTVIFVVTGVFMMTLARKAKRTALDQRLTRDIDEKVGKLGKESKD